MITPFTFKGKIGRVPYAAWSVALFLSQYLVVLAGVGVVGALLKANGLILLVPHRALIAASGPWTLLQMLGLAYLRLLAWALAALGFRRAVDADVGDGTAAFVIAPVSQIPAILFLWLSP